MQSKFYIYTGVTSRDERKRVHVMSQSQRQNQSVTVIDLAAIKLNIKRKVLSNRGSLSAVVPLRVDSVEKLLRL